MIGVLGPGKYSSEVTCAIVLHGTLVHECERLTTDSPLAIRLASPETVISVAQLLNQWYSATSPPLFGFTICLSASEEDLA